MSQLNDVATQMVTGGRGVLAADESIKTMSARLEAEGVDATATNRRDYRELLLTAPRLSDTVSGIILSDETFGQTLADGQPFPEACRERGVLPGIKVDTGVTPLPKGGGATVTEGLDGLGARLASYAERGAAFAKWRAVIDVTNTSAYAREANAHALARYAALCQEHGIVPIVEPEVLCSGPHDLGTSADVTAAALAAVFDQLERQRVELDGIVLKPNMVTPGLDGPPTTPETVAATTLNVLGSHVPADVPGIAFLSGGHSNEQSCTYLGAINEMAGDAPWSLTFSFGRALVSDALRTWKGEPGKVEAAQQALLDNCRRASQAVGRRP
ncbi:MAG TPA: class I fructose-bisphosphate aldolase, partial [Nocardioidaceae bacterium]